MPKVTAPNGRVVGEITDAQELAYYRSAGYSVGDSAATKPATLTAPKAPTAPDVPAGTPLDLATDRTAPKETQE